MLKMSHLIKNKQLNGKLIISCSLDKVELKHLKILVSCNFTAYILLIRRLFSYKTLWILCITILMHYIFNKSIGSDA